MRIWDLTSYELVKTLEHTWFVRKLAFSRDDQLLATLDDEGVVHVWSPATAELLYRFASQRGFLDFADSAIVTTGKGAIVLFPTR